MKTIAEYCFSIGVLLFCLFLCAAAHRSDLLIIPLAVTSLVVSLALPRVPRHRVGAGVLRGAPAPTPDSPSSRLRQNAATVG